MTIVSEFNYGQSTKQFEEYTSLLFAIAKAGDGKTDVQGRIGAVERMSDAFITCRGTRPDSTQLDRLASLILRDELTDKNEHKMAQQEYPLLSDRQQERRHRGEVSARWTESVAIDGRDYQPKTRDYMRKLREISR